MSSEQERPERRWRNYDQSVHQGRTVPDPRASDNEGGQGRFGLTEEDYRNYQAQAEREREDKSAR